MNGGTPAPAGEGEEEFVSPTEALTGQPRPGAPAAGPEERRRRAERSLRVAEAALARYATATHRKSRWRIATTLFAQAAALTDLGRFEEALAACDEVIRHYGQATDGPTQVLTAAALRYRRVCLRQLGETQELILTCDEVIRRYAQATDPLLAQEVLVARQERQAAAGGGTSIRPVRPDELEAVAALTVAAFQQYAPLVSPAFLRDWMSDAGRIGPRLERAEVLVAEHAGALAGTVTLYRNGEGYWMAEWPVEWATVRLLAVDPAARGLGIGRALVEACLERARALPAATVGLHTAGFMAAAQGLYESLGFVRVPSLDVSEEGAPEALAYRRDLA